MHIGLITRCKEEPYVTEFVHYYLSQGVDHIYIVDDDSSREIYRDVSSNPSVTILYGNKISIWEQQFDTCRKLYSSIRDKYDWIINVDMDEYITTRKYATRTIRDELETTFKECICIKIPWVIMACNSMEKNPTSLLKDTIYRWNHDNKHIGNCSVQKFRCRYDKIEVKCIFKPAFFNDITMHHPLKPISTDISIVEGVHNQPSALSPFYTNLREKDIEEGYLLCYHYRIVSVEQCKKKISTNLHYKKYTLEDLLSFDYPEVIDRTMHTK